MSRGGRWGEAEGDGEEEESRSWRSKSSNVNIFPCGAGVELEEDTCKTVSQAD